MRQPTRIDTIDFEADSASGRAQMLAPIDYEVDALVGELVAGRYVIEDRVGAGSFGCVYRARHRLVPRDIALKILHEDMASDAQWVRRFEREVRALGLLRHPHIVDVFDFGKDPAFGYFTAMEFLEGNDLADRLAHGPDLSIVEILTIVDQLAGALGAAHELGIIHRDVKPENIFMVPTEDGSGFNTKLLDFGVAKVVPPSAVRPRRPPLPYVVGSPYTMSPEQVYGEPVDQRSDLYSLGVVTYELLTGGPPYEVSGLAEMRDALESGPPPRPSARSAAAWIPPELDELVVAMLEHDPALRPASAREIREALSWMRFVVEDAWAAYHLTESAVPSLARRAHLPGQPARVLVVDDEPAFRSFIQRILWSHGFQCGVSTSAEAALRELGGAAYDAVVADVLMPGMDGLELTRRLRELGFRGPIVVCSCVSTSILEGQALKDGATAVLDKSEQLRELPHLLRALSNVSTHAGQVAAAG